MIKDLPSKTLDRIDSLIDAIHKNEYIFAQSPSEELEKCYDFSSNIVISKNIDFLKAVQNEMGGKIIKDKSIGVYLYFE